MLRWLRNRKIRRLEKQVLDLEAQLQAKDRIIAVRDEEIEQLSAVIVRDRERVRAEMAAHVLKQAEASND